MPIKKLMRYWQVVFLGVAVCFYIGTMSQLSILRHNAFASGLDLGNMDQTVWNTLHGRPFALTYEGFNQLRFAAHSDLFLILLAPFYLVWSSPHMLNIIESIYLALGAIAVFLIAARVLKSNNLALLLALMYLSSPVVQWIDIFDFHSVSFAVPALLAAFYCALSKRWRWYALFIALALITKEHIGLQVFVLGLTVACVFKEQRIGFITAAIGLGFSIFMMFILLPQFSPSGAHWALGWYDFGAQSLQKIFFDPRTHDYIELVFKSFGFLPLLGLPWLMLTAPDFLINILSSHTEMQSIKYHYTSGLVPGMMIASVYGLYFVKKNIRAPMAPHIIAIAALLITLRVNYHYSPLPTTESCWCQMYRVSENDKKFSALLQKIPQTASVTSSTELHAHLTHREFAYMLPYATDSADYIALIDEPREIDRFGKKQYELDLIEKLNAENNYVLLQKIGNYFLYKRTNDTNIYR